MTNIDKAEALAALRKHAKGKTVLGGQVYQSLTLETALGAIAALPARGVGVPQIVIDQLNVTVGEVWHEMVQDAEDAEFTGERPDLHDYQVSIPYDHAVAILAALAPTDAAQAPFRIEDMTLADLMRDPLYEAATTPATDAAQARELAEDDDDKYLIIKRGVYFRPNRQGYTSSVAEAGRYTLAQAVFLSHPNGPDGPRDGMSFVPLAALIGETRT